MKRKTRLDLRRWILTASLLAWTVACAATGISIPAGAAIQLGGGQLALANGNLALSGSLQLGAGRIVQLLNFQVLAGGSAVLGSGQITLSGDWSNASTIHAGSSHVHFVDGGQAASGVLGSTTFASASFVSSIGKRYFFQSGSTQTMSQLLTIQGTQPAPIQFDVTSPGSIARINLMPAGSQHIQHVGVGDVHATGQHLAPNQHNEGGRGNASGWFSALLAPSTPVPELGPWAMLALLLLLSLAGVWTGARSGAKK